MNCELIFALLVLLLVVVYFLRKRTLYETAVFTRYTHTHTLNGKIKERGWIGGKNVCENNKVILRAASSSYATLTRTIARSSYLVLCKILYL
jgi:hypothetical protein